MLQMKTIAVLLVTVCMSACSESSAPSAGESDGWTHPSVNLDKSQFLPPPRLNYMSMIKNMSPPILAPEDAKSCSDYEAALRWNNDDMGRWYRAHRDSSGPIPESPKTKYLTDSVPADLLTNDQIVVSGKIVDSGTNSATNAAMWLLQLKDNSLVAAIMPADMMRIAFVHDKKLANGQLKDESDKEITSFEDVGSRDDAVVY